MDNFDYYNPTRILFGRGRIADLARWIPDEARVLILSGGQSAEKYGTLDEVRQALQGRFYCEFRGIEPNPQTETLLRALPLIQRERITFLLAVGGGSVIDGSKFLAAAAYAPETVWQHWRDNQPLQRALPLGCVLTLPATGSEMNATAVVTHTPSGEKKGFRDPLLFPQFAVLDPQKSYTLPAHQIACGVVDAFVHVTEQYLTYPVGAKVQDRYAEGLLQTLLEEGPKALQQPEDYTVRATLMWAATQALNGLIGVGVPQDWATHRIGHQLTALYGLAHGETLAVILPALLEAQRHNKAQKLLQYGQRVFGIEQGDAAERITRAIACTREFFTTMGLPCSLRAYALPEQAIDAVVANLQRFAMLPLGERRDIDAEAVRRILARCF